MPVKPLLSLDEVATRDLWWEARQENQNYRGSWLINMLSKIGRVVVKPPSLMQRFGTLESVMAVDLNSYRQNVNVELLIDQGVRVFMLRVTCPGRWEYGNWQYFVDSTFTGYHKRIRDYAKAKGIAVWIVGYGVHNPWSNEESGYNGLDPQVTMLKEATRNHQCDIYCWDDEVAECWKNGGNTVMTPTNLVKSVSICMEQTFNEFERNIDGTHKMVMHYSANWYMKKYASSGYTVWLDNANKDVNSRHVLTWRAWVPTVFSTGFDLIRTFFDQWIVPTGIQENSYLRLGSNLAADFWQGSFTAMGPWCPKKTDGTYQFGIDASISYGPSATLAEFIYNSNLTQVTTDTTPPSAPGPVTAKYVAPSVTVTWSAASDNVAVEGYYLKRNGTVLSTLAVLSFTDSGVTPGQSYTYEVTAFDKAGNAGPAVSVSITIPIDQPPSPSGYVTREEFLRHTHNTGGPVVTG
jgi:hypothetical protein